MSSIGTFTKDAEGNGFTGTITTLSLRAKATLKPVAKTSPRMPDYRVYANNVEIGGAWAVLSKEDQRPYLSVKLDDPSFASAIYARLIEVEDGRHQLLWSR